MAEYNADNYASFNAQPQEQIPVGDVSGKKRVLFDQITLTVELAVNDLINVGAPLPANARVVNCIVLSEALGTTGSLKLGHAADDDYFLAATSFAAAAKASMASEAGLLVKSSAKIQPQLKCTAVSTAGVGKKIKVLIEYVLE